VPPNCRFEVDDAEKEWTHKSVLNPLNDFVTPYTRLMENQDSFDFIHSRGLGQAVTDWPAMMLEIYRYILPSNILLHPTARTANQTP
jgi:hypothetical protein